MNVFGLDIGGSGIKGAPVETATGELIHERVRIKTPQPATPEAIVRTAVEVVSEAGWQGPVGCGFPAVVKDGVSLQQLVDGLNALGIGPRDLIAILQAIKAAGAIQADIEVM